MTSRRRVVTYSDGGTAVIGTFTNARTDERFPVQQSPTSIGRHEANAIRLRGFAVSRFHAEIGETEPGTCTKV